MAASADTFYSRDLSVERNPSPRQLKSPAELKEGAPTDHMVDIDWTQEAGWSKPRIVPYQPIAVDPCSTVLHYATSVFEGMKAYKSHDNTKTFLFRPMDNMNRLNDSCTRVLLPNFDAAELLKILDKFVALESHFISPGETLYLRPYAFGMKGHGLSLRRSVSSKLCIVAMKMKAPESAMNLYASPENCIRAWPGGFGSSKVSANYGPSVPINELALTKGCAMVLWLFGEERLVTEAGGCNLFVVWKTRQGKTEILTCPLTKDLILPGVTRRAVLDLLKEYDNENCYTGEREFTLSDLREAHDEQRLLEAFTAGTALFITPVRKILIDGQKDIAFPTGEDYGYYGAAMKKRVSDIQFGQVQHPWTHQVSSD